MNAKVYMLAFAVFLRAILPFAAGEESSAQRVTVLSYNIHHGEGMDGKIDWERIAKVITSVAPDVVAVQEVDRNTTRSGNIDEAETLARLTNMHMIFGRTIDYAGGQYGNMILSGPEILKSSNHPVPYTKGREPRAVLRAEIAPRKSQGVAPNQNSVIIYATHFDFTPDSTDRLAAVGEIEKLARKDGDRPAVLAGDLNSTPESSTLKALGALWQVAERGRPLFTTPVERPTRQIDFILYRPRGRWTVLETRVLDEKVASDHRPICATLELSLK